MLILFDLANWAMLKEKNLKDPEEYIDHFFLSIF